MNLMIFNNYYQLDKSFHNFVIIYCNDTYLKRLSVEFETRVIKKKDYMKLMREHIRLHYNLRYGNLLNSYRNKILKGE